MALSVVFSLFGWLTCWSFTRRAWPRLFLDACSACKSGPDSGKNLSRTLLLALLCAENDNCASEHWQRPLQVTQLLLGSSDIIWCGRGWLGRPIHGVSIALGGFSAENPAIDGGAKGSSGEQNLSDSICGDTRLVLGAISVGVKEHAAPDEVGADRAALTGAHFAHPTDATRARSCGSRTAPAAPFTPTAPISEPPNQAAAPRS